MQSKVQLADDVANGGGFTSVRFVASGIHGATRIHQQPGTNLLYITHQNTVTEVDDTRDWRNSTFSVATKRIVAEFTEKPVLRPKAVFTYKGRLFCLASKHCLRNSTIRLCEMNTSAHNTKPAVHSVVCEVQGGRGSCFQHDNQLFCITYYGDLHPLDVDINQHTTTDTPHSHKRSLLQPDLMPEDRYLGYPSDVLIETSRPYRWLIGGVGTRCGLRRLDMRPLSNGESPIVNGWNDYEAVRGQKLAQLHDKLYTLAWSGSFFSEAETTVYEHDVLELDADELENEDRRPRAVRLDTHLGVSPIDMTVHDNLLIVANENGDIYSVDPLASPSKRTRKLLSGAIYGPRVESAMCSGMLSHDTRVLHSTVHEALCYNLVDDVVSVVQAYVGPVAVLYVTNDVGNLYACQV